MPRQRRDDRSSSGSWLPRLADQAGVALLILLALAGIVSWWVSQGGLQGRLIEMQQAPPLAAAFRVDINVADWPEFCQLPGIGETLARRIVQTRAIRGRFVDHQDLRHVRGIGPKTLERIRPYLLPIADGNTLAGK
jgi:competence protein ComEA